MKGNSPLAQLMQNIDLQYESVQRVLESLTPTGRHAYINARMENIANRASERAAEIGPFAAQLEACEALAALHDEIAAAKAAIEAAEAAQAVDDVVDTVLR
jgi:hypothetical protein